MTLRMTLRYDPQNDLQIVPQIDLQIDPQIDHPTIDPLGEKCLQCLTVPNSAKQCQISHILVKSVIFWSILVNSGHILRCT